jgi:hypothetical protein
MLMLKRVIRRLKWSHPRKPPRCPDRYQDTQKYLSGSKRLRINFPQAEKDFDPPLFYPTEKWKGGSRWGYLDLKSAFQVLYRSLNMMGYVVNECDDQNVDIVFNWAGRKIEHRASTEIFMEHGWIPRWSYQISDLGTNSKSHCAQNYNNVMLNHEERAFVINYIKKMQQIFAIGMVEGKVTQVRKSIGEPFILFPFQLATDFNLKHSNSDFVKYYSKDPANNIHFAQACVDYLEKAQLPLPIVFKQHPGDHNDLRNTIKIRNKKNMLLNNKHQLSTHDIFASGLCRLVISVNSNTVHEAAIWAIPSICLGTLIWNEQSTPRPFPQSVESAENLIGVKPMDSEACVAYLYHLIKWQWFLSDFQNPLMIQELIKSHGRCEPFTVRQRFGLANGSFTANSL